MKTDVVINNFNREIPLRRLLLWLLNDAVDVNKVIILDNDSTWEGTLQLYKEFEKDVEIIKFGKNLGHFHSFKTYFNTIGNGNIILTDPDMYPQEGKGNDIIPLLYEGLHNYPNKIKCGAGLKIDDLPQNSVTVNVVNHENRHANRIYTTACKKFIEVSVDTTFCLYRDKSCFGNLHNNLRTIGDYEWHHWDWYHDLNNLPEEYKYYLNVCNSSASWAKTVKIELTK